MSDDTRSATRDYRALSDTPWKFWGTLYARRSVRKYSELPLEEDLPRRLDDVIDLSLRVRGAKAGSVRAYTEGRVVSEIKAACSKGAANKINVWLLRSKPSGFVLVQTEKKDIKLDRPEMLPVSCLVTQDVVLWLAENGVGSCWMAAVNQKELARITGADRDSTVVLAVCFGPPLQAQAGGYDAFMRKRLTKKRKPLGTIAFLETTEHHYEPSSVSPGNFSAPGGQDVSSLLEAMGKGEGSGKGTDPGSDLVVDACFEAGRVAPSSSNSQSWSFIAVREPDKLRAVEKACGAGGWGTAIVVLASGNKIGMLLTERPFWMIDGPIAVSHISLMAASMGRAVEVFINGIDALKVESIVRAGKRFQVVGVVGIS